MKRIIIIVVLVIVGIIIICLIPVTEKNTISISATELIVSQQLNNADNWKKWDTDLKNAAENDSAKYIVINDYQQHCFSINTSQQFIQVKSRSSNHFEITIQKEGNTSLYEVMLSSGKDFKSTVVITEKKVSVFLSILSSAKNKTNGEQFINYLKTFLETDSLYYGFSISIQPVMDSNIVIYKRQVSSAEKFSVLQQMYGTLKDYIYINHLEIMQPPILLYNSISNDSVTAVTMFAVNKTAPNNDSVRCMKMPVKGRMLVGKFRGKYKDRIQLQTAMQQYCLDKNIISIVSSYDKFTDNRVPENEDTIVEMEIHFPIL